MDLRQKGLDWMRNDVEDAVEKDVLTFVSELRLSKDEEEDFDKSLVHELSPETLTRGHTVLAAEEIKDKIAKRMEFGDYLLNPTKHKFGKTIHIYSIVIQAVKKFAALVKLT